MPSSYVHFFPSAYIEYGEKYMYIYIEARTSKTREAKPTTPSHPPAASRKQSAHVNDRPPRPLSFPPHLRATSGTGEFATRWKRGEREREIE